MAIDGFVAVAQHYLGFANHRFVFPFFAVALACFFIFFFFSFTIELCKVGKTGAVGIETRLWCWRQFSFNQPNKCENNAFSG
jgi:hypothetical protein